MITVSPEKNIQKVKELFSKHAVAFTDFAGAVIAKDNNEVLGYCLYDLTEKSFTVYEIEPKDDIMLADGILRSALHIAAERSVMDARYADGAPVDLFQKLGFVKNIDEKMLDIDKLFGGCHCGT
ncbi:MAG: hypothetical protein IKK24_04145 [Clostridia bacterium]|nr:hypothetical protein [Clostridia bacterium]